MMLCIIFYLDDRKERKLMFYSFLNTALDYLPLDDFLGSQSSHTVSQEAGPLRKYDETVRSGKLKLDKYQRQIVEHLQRLHDDVVNYKPASSGFFSKVGSLTLIF